MNRFNCKTWKVRVFLCNEYFHGKIRIEDDKQIGIIFNRKKFVSYLLSRVYKYNKYTCTFVRQLPSYLLLPFRSFAVVEIRVNR